MRGMVKMRATRWAAVAVAVCVGLGAAGCSSGGDGASSPPATTAAPAGGSASSTTAPAMTVEDAYRAYQATMGPGCTTAEECQDLMTRRLAALDDLRTAMQTASPARYQVPIQDAERADRLADQYGRDNLGSVGNMQAVMGPVQDVVSWYAANR